MTDSLIHFYFTYLFVPNFLLVLYTLYLIIYKSKNKGLYTILLVALTFLIKFNTFYFNCGSNDETGWIAYVHALAADFNPYISVDPTTSGIGALIPLYLFDQIIHINYFTIRLLETIIDMVTLYFTYKILITRIGNNKNLLYLSMMFLYCILNVSFMRDFYTYNTEHFCVLVFAVLLYILNNLFIQGDKGNDQTTASNISINIAGLLVGFSLFIKLQNLPVMFFMFMFFLLYLMVKKYFRQAFFFIVCCIIPVLTCLLFFWYKGSIHDFYIRYLITNLEYSDNGVIDAHLQAKTGLSLHSIIEHSSFIFIEVYSLVFLSIFMVVLLNLRYILRTYKPIMAFSMKKVKTYVSDHKLQIIFLLFFIIDTFEIVKPKNFFDHYYLLLYQPLILLFVCVSKLQVKKWVMVFIVTINFIFIFGKNYIYAEADITDTSRYIPFRESQHRAHFVSIFGADKQYHNELKQLDSVVKATNADDRYIMVWGQDIRIYAYSRYLSAFRDIGNYHLLAHKGEMKTYYINDFMSDLDKNVKGNKIILIEETKGKSLANSQSFEEFVNENNLEGHFKIIKLLPTYPLYSFHVIEMERN